MGHEDEMELNLGGQTWWCFEVPRWLNSNDHGGNLDQHGRISSLLPSLQTPIHEGIHTPAALVEAG